MSVDIRIDSKCYPGLFVLRRGQCVDHFELLRRLDIESKDIVVQRVSNLFVRLAHACEHYFAWIEAGFNRFAYLVSTDAIGTETRVANTTQEAVIEIRLEGIMHMETQGVGGLASCCERLCQQAHDGVNK